ncbi:MAG: prephenate dehydrogenase/arogenate dehydrogenase family protein, partial [Armatimonadetes bacterium]|nr:prephenate dehydrogenase/arogenate dehydrogenase family protein [Armatimonadota bacterium]
SHHSFARGSLFVDSSWILCSWDANSKEAIWKVESMVYALDSEPTWMSPTEHDEHVALLSHLPHALAAIMVQMANELNQPELGGNSWRDLTRVDGNYPELWRQVMLSNRDSVVNQIDELQARLSALKNTLAAEDSKTLLDFFRRAEQIKLGHPRKPKTEKSALITENAEIDSGEESQTHSV